MAHCPSCQTEIGDDFGLVNCPGCGVVCFVDLDGNVILQNEDMQNYDGDATEEVTDPQGRVAAHEEVTDPQGGDNVYSLHDDGEDDFNIGGESTENYASGTGDYLSETGDYTSGAEDGITETGDYATDSESDVAELGDYAAADAESAAIEADDYATDAESYTLDEQDEDSDDSSGEYVLADEDTEAEEHDPENSDDDAYEGEGAYEGDGGENSAAGLSASEEGDAEELEDAAPSAMSVDDFLNEIEVFGAMNSEPFQAAAYFFDITISGIDSKDVRTEVLETLSNSKFRLEEENLSKKIIAGQLQLFQIPAVKAAIIIQSLAHLNCELDWKLKEAQDLGFEDSVPYAEESTEGGEEPIAEDSDSFDDLIESYEEEEGADLEDDQEYEDSEYDSES